MSNVQSGQAVIKGEQVEFEEVEAEGTELKAPRTASSIFATAVMTVIALCFTAVLIALTAKFVLWIL